MRTLPSAPSETSLHLRKRDPLHEVFADGWAGPILVVVIVVVPPLLFLVVLHAPSPSSSPLAAPYILPSSRSLSPRFAQRRLTRIPTAD